MELSTNIHMYTHKDESNELFKYIIHENQKLKQSQLQLV